MRQAVVIIHGIGEQRPMETLRAFVAGALGVDRDALKEFVFSKPDRIDDTLELRRLSVSTKENVKESPLEKGCETDFYELYWQHLMLGTTSRPVLEWALYLLCHPNRLNHRLHGVWWGVVVIMAAVAIALTVALLVLKPLLAVGLTIAVPALWIGIRFLKWLAVGQVERLVLGFAGDAFRYLNPDPPNVQVRRAIRTAGLTLLRRLHEDELRRYERIILVGHSLGSVIAYDLIIWFWQEQHHRVEIGSKSGERKTVVTRHADTKPNNKVVSPLDELADPSLPSLKDAPNEFPSSQRSLWQKLRERHHLPWRITDLVTLGSPLAHADVLLAESEAAFREGTRQREFPTCPPKGEDCRDRGLLGRTYKDGKGEHYVHILHHGAPFAVTRWTNLYFPGDIIGGAVASLFGKGIKDVKLRFASRGWLDRLIPARSHTRYWDYLSERHASEELTKALHLNDLYKEKLRDGGFPR